MDLAELSAAAVPESRFAVPAGYQTAAMEDLLSALFPAVQAPVGGPKAEIPRGATVGAPAGQIKVLRSLDVGLDQKAVLTFARCKIDPMEGRRNADARPCQTGGDLPE